MATASLIFFALCARWTVYHGHECERLHPALAEDLCLPSGFQETSLPGSHEHESCPVCQSYEAPNDCLVVWSGNLAAPLAEIQISLFLQERAVALPARPAFSARAPPF